MMALRKTLGQFPARMAPGAGRFWMWWKGALRSWIPARWQVALGMVEERLLLRLHPDGVEVLHAREGQLRSVVALPALADRSSLTAAISAHEGRLPRVLLLPEDGVLRRPMRLPAAAERRLRDVVRFEIDRQTPFPAEQVCFDVRVLGRRSDGQLDVELVVVPGYVLEALLSPEEVWLGQLDGVDVMDVDGAPLGVNLLPSAQRRIGRDPVQRLNHLLLLGALVFAALAARQLLENRRDAATQLAAQVEASAVRAREVSVQRQQLQDLVDGHAFLARQREQQAPATEVINDLSRRLADDTWLERLSIENDRMQLTGRSSSASSLVSRLENASLWKRPSLTSVLRAGNANTQERFTLTAELKPRQEVADGTAVQSK